MHICAAFLAEPSSRCASIPTNPQNLSLKSKDNPHASKIADLLVLDQVLAWEHRLMQDSTDEDSVGIRPIKNDVPLVLKAAVSGPNSIALAADLGSFGKSIEACFETIEIS
jgi:hypothetical protein